MDNERYTPSDDAVDTANAVEQMFRQEQRELGLYTTPVSYAHEYMTNLFPPPVLASQTKSEIARAMRRGFIRWKQRKLQDLQDPIECAKIENVNLMVLGECANKYLNRAIKQKEVASGQSERDEADQEISYWERMVRATYEALM